MVHPEYAYSSALLWADLVKNYYLGDLYGNEGKRDQRAAAPRLPQRTATTLT